MNPPGRFRREFPDNNYFEIIEEQLQYIKNDKIKIFWVGDEHRKHPWSLRPGGTTVVVVYKDKRCQGYDKVKRPHKYMPKIIGENIHRVLNRNDNLHISTLKQYLESIHIVREGEVILNTVWNNNSNMDPWLALERYATE